MRHPDRLHEHDERIEELRRLMKVRAALEQTGLCGPDTDPDNNGRDLALQLIRALAEQRVLVHPLADLLPPTDPLPSLKERIGKSAQAVGTRISRAAQDQRKRWTRRREERTSP